MGVYLFQRHEAGVLMPACREAEAFLSSLRFGYGIRVEATPARNVLFHRKIFKLFEVAFDMWEPNRDLRIDGMSVREDFVNFRKKLTILAGFYVERYDRNGNLTLEAQSLAFGAMDGAEFARVYKAVREVIWTRVLIPGRYKSREELDAVVDELSTY